MTGPEMKLQFSEYQWTQLMTSGLQKPEVRAIAHHLQVTPDVPSQASKFIGIVAERVQSYGEPSDEECGGNSRDGPAPAPHITAIIPG